MHCDLGAVQRLEHLREHELVAGQPVQVDCDHHVQVPGFGVGQQPHHRGALVELLAGDSAVDVLVVHLPTVLGAHFAPSPQLVGQAGAVFGGLALGRDSGVERGAHRSLSAHALCSWLCSLGRRRLVDNFADQLNRSVSSSRAASTAGRRCCCPSGCTTATSAAT